MKQLIIQLLIIFIIIIIFYNIVRIIRTNSKEKRISEFSLSKKDFNENSILERFNLIIWNIIHNISNILSRSNLFLKKAIKYEKYILIKEEKYKSSIDYVTIKYLNIILAITLYFLIILLFTLKFNIFILIIFIILGLFLPDFLWKLSYINKCKNISSRLYESIIILDDNISKSNIYNSINKVINESSEEISDEYQRIFNDLSYNLTLYQAFKRFYERTKIPEIKTIYHLLNVEQDNIEKTFHLIRKEFEYIDKQNDYKHNTNIILNVLSSVFVLIPLLLIIFITIINPDYFKLVISSLFGIVILIVIELLYIALIFSIRRVLEERK
ncbi:MAG: hypothetical protein IJ572_02320 [Bacilli bacterium]|nr:hypothetical protein [Bacilli bacterium]